MSHASWKKKLALWATLFRMLIAPVIVCLVLVETPYWNWICMLLFITGSISDWLDGHWARKHNAVSDLGKLLDPIADKVLVSTVLILLVSLNRIEALLVIILLNRDLIINALRSYAASQGRVIAAGSLGKWKTAIQMVAIPLLLLNLNLFSVPLVSIGYWGLWLSAVLSLASAATYIYNYQSQQSASAGPSIATT